MITKRDIVVAIISFLLYSIGYKIANTDIDKVETKKRNYGDKKLVYLDKSSILDIPDTNKSFKSSVPPHKNSNK